MDITNVLMIVLYVLAGLAILTILVVVHEGGHFLIGKKLGFGIVEFGVGFGPKLFSKVRKGIRYSLRAFPVGGFVQFVGEDDNDSDPKAFNNQPAWKRLLTIFAGPFMNVICVRLRIKRRGIPFQSSGIKTPCFHCRGRGLDP